MVSVAVIGTGGLGSRHVANFASVPGCTVRRVYDLDPAAAEAAAAPAEAEVAGSADACCADDIDAVVIATPTYVHTPYVLQAAAAGKHVFCEKPLARSLSEGEAAVEAAARAGVKLMVGHVVRYFPAYVTAHQAIREGKLGRVGMARLQRINFAPSKPWYQDYSLSGGVLHDLSIHDLDWLLWTFGRPVRVFARSLYQQLPRLDYGLAELRFAGGEIAHVEGSFADVQGFRTNFDLAGSGGLLRHDSTVSPTVSFQRRDTAAGAGSYLPMGAAVKSPYQLEAELFVEAVRQDTPPPITGEDGLEAIRLSLACLQSAETGQVVRLG